MHSIYEYNNYRIFIADYIRQKQKKNPGFSYRRFVELTGINSCSLASLVVRGKRNLTKSSILKFSKALHLDRAELLFFENLVFYNQTKCPVEKEHYCENLIHLKKFLFRKSEPL